MTEEVDLSCLPLKDRFKRLLKSSEFADCSFIFEKDGNHAAHKLVLSAASPAFRAMFFGELTNDEPVEIVDIRPEIFKLMLNFIYTDESLLRSSDAHELYYAADKYMLQSLKQTCLKEIERTFCASNACKNYEFAEIYDLEKLKSDAKKIICNETSNILPFVNDLGLSTLLEILDFEELNISSELEMFNAVIRWGVSYLNEFSAKKFQLNTTTEKNKSLRSIVDLALKKIRFLTLSSKEFAKSLAKSEILTENERHHILMNILNKSTSFPMPDGFSANTQKRKVFSADKGLDGFGIPASRISSPISTCAQVMATPFPRNSGFYLSYDPNVVYTQVPVPILASKLKDQVKIKTELSLKIEARMKQLLTKRELTDSTFVIINAGETVKFDVHKLILSIASPVFRGMLSGRTSNDEPVKIEDISPQQFRILLEYMYTDVWDLSKVGNISEFALIAFKYGLAHLLEKCINALITRLTSKNALQHYECARRMNLPADHRFYLHCLKLIIQNCKGVTEDPSFCDIELSTLTMMLNFQPHLQISNTQLFESIMRWACKECERKALMPNKENLRSVVDPALKKIDFLTFSATEFAIGPAESRIFTESESFAILTNILKQSGVPMPEGFSTKTQGKLRHHPQVMFDQDYATGAMMPLQSISVPSSTQDYVQNMFGVGPYNQTYCWGSFASCPPHRPLPGDGDLELEKSIPVVLRKLFEEQDKQ